MITIFVTGAGALGALSPKESELDEEDLKSALAELEGVSSIITHTVVSSPGNYRLSTF